MTLSLKAILDADARWFLLLVCLLVIIESILIIALATDIDGTSTTGLNIPCPDVTPYSKIYFLQLYVDLADSHLWIVWVFEPFRLISTLALLFV